MAGAQERGLEGITRGHLHRRGCAGDEPDVADADRGRKMPKCLAAGKGLVADHGRYYQPLRGRECVEVVAGLGGRVAKCEPGQRRLVWSHVNGSWESPLATGRHPAERSLKCSLVGIPTGRRQTRGHGEPYRPTEKDGREKAVGDRHVQRPAAGRFGRQLADGPRHEQPAEMICSEKSSRARPASFHGRRTSRPLQAVVTTTAAAA